MMTEHKHQPQPEKKPLDPKRVDRMEKMFQEMWAKYSIEHSAEIAEQTRKDIARSVPPQAERNRKFVYDVIHYGRSDAPQSDYYDRH